MNQFAWLLLPLVLIWAFERFYLRGKKVPDYPVPDDASAVRHFAQADGPGDAHRQAIKTIRESTLKIGAALQKSDIRTARQAFDSIADGIEYNSEFVSCDANGVSAEWVIAPGSDPNRRALYIHGGGFIMGSPKSHRTITSRFSEVSGCAVLAIDYRLLPEHPHKAGMEDCRTAYRWILENGPNGPAPAEQLFIGGDSAGGNLTLSLLAWIRDNQLRTPDAAVALSPVTDITFSGDSMRGNLHTDHMLRPFLLPLTRLPAFIRSWWVLKTYRVRPGDTGVSPLLGDLSHLPPLLVQASTAEMLLDDARRYVFKARASGSDARLQTWADALHVWQIFYPHLPQAVDAWNEIAGFLNEHGATATMR